ncbi:Retrovirus-related Pol polyprotein from transposon RE1 [Vitis vinifera]|uniref:Retrovirus-related Pol polyprotein from transposon RE1 n=1 Tax=Vitis vinifera TaxID=29760 RepID=A0A438E3B0_VITVI|nr:Retrovirus-related Pol polyprotein from transposon RE1 [Vitis vinifera]
MFLPTAKDVWDAVREMYSDAENASQIFEIKMRLWQMKQGDREVVEYYTEMLGLWQDLDLSCEEEWECTGDSVRFKKKMENERVFEFLAGLNHELDDVRSRVLNRRPLPSIREVFSEVRREEIRRRDLSSGKTIGSAKEREGLYYFDETDGESMSETRPSLTSDYLDVAMFESIPCLISTPSPNTKGHLNSGGDTELQKNRETLVYSRRPKSKFNETLISEAPKESELVIVPTPQEYGSNFDQVTDDLPIALRKQSRSCTLHPISKFVSYNFLFAKCHAFTTNLDKIQIPKNIQEAFKIPEWKEVVMKEIRALEKNENWEVMNLPRGKKLVGCKWIFTVKYKTDGTIELYKACLVAKGFTRTYGIDYIETFAPVAKLNTIRVLLSLAANLDWPLRQFDIKNAFLNGELEEEVFMMLPPGFCKEEEETRVCKLKKSLYGLKQLPRAWFDRFAKVIKNQGYQQGQSDHTIFFKQSNDGRITMLIVYVDDIILTGDDTGEVERLKKVLATEFEVKDLGQMRYFLGMERYPIEARNRMESDGKPVDKEKYQRLVGKLIYLSHIRPDIAFAHKFIEKCKCGASAMLPKIEKARQIRASMALQAQSLARITSISGDAPPEGPKLNEDYGDTVPSRPFNNGLQVTNERGGVVREDSEQGSLGLTSRNVNAVYLYITWVEFGTVIVHGGFEMDKTANQTPVSSTKEPSAAHENVESHPVGGPGIKSTNNWYFSSTVLLLFT